MVRSRPQAPVADLRAVEDSAFQALDRGAVLLEMLRREVVEMDLHDAHEAGQGLDYCSADHRGHSTALSMRDHSRMSLKN